MIRKIQLLHCRRKQAFRVRKMLPQLTAKQRVNLLFVRKNKKGRERHSMPVDPLLLRNAPEIDALFKRVTTGVGLSEAAYLCLKKHYQQLRSHYYETKRGERGGVVNINLYLTFYIITLYSPP